MIQRRRWANGGLLILPKLLLLLQRDRGTRPSMGELLMRLHYLSSIAGVNAGLLLLLTLPFADWLSSPGSLTALPTSPSMRTTSAWPAIEGSTSSAYMH